MGRQSSGPRKVVIRLEYAPKVYSVFSTVFCLSCCLLLVYGFLLLVFGDEKLLF